ncbi:MAG: methyltransferase domain-containing protein [Oscillospiraceae bacterium]|nr:methyltransferase domain-containing protein [Oscillospiraceae bacterium]
MASYEYLAAAYDELMRDADYARRADFVEALFLRTAKREVHTLLDLACGTGTMTRLFTERGYELIAVDGSEDMLMEAREKAQGLRGIEPLFLHQSMPRLDLNDTVDAAICCLDSLNYLTNPRDLRRTFERLRLFVSPGGALVFDVHARGKLEAMDGRTYLDEDEDVCCVWRTTFRRDLLDYCVDLFTRRADGAWERETEYHRQRWYSAEDLSQWLAEAGFTDIRVYGDCRRRRPNASDGRIYISARRK